jgi:hypothetical protein
MESRRSFLRYARSADRCAQPIWSRLDAQFSKQVGMGTRRRIWCGSAVLAPCSQLRFNVRIGDRAESTEPVLGKVLARQKVWQREQSGRAS